MSGPTAALRLGAAISSVGCRDETVTFETGEMIPGASSSGWGSTSKAAVMKGPVLAPSSARARQ